MLCLFGRVPIDGRIDLTVNQAPTLVNIEGPNPSPATIFQTLAAMLNTYSSPIYAGESDVGAVVLQMLSGSGAKKASALGVMAESGLLHRS